MNPAELSLVAILCFGLGIVVSYLVGFLGHNAALVAAFAFLIGFPTGLGLGRLFSPPQRKIPMVGRVFSFPQAPVMLEIAAKRAGSLIPARGVTVEE